MNTKHSQHIDYSEISAEELESLHKEVKRVWNRYEYEPEPRFMCVYLPDKETMTAGKILDCVFSGNRFNTNTLAGVLHEFLHLNGMWTGYKLREVPTYNYWLYFKVTGKLMSGKRIILEAKKLGEQRL